MKAGVEEGLRTKDDKEEVGFHGGLLVGVRANAWRHAHRSLPSTKTMSELGKAWQGVLSKAEQSLSGLKSLNSEARELQKSDHV